MSEFKIFIGSSTESSKKQYLEAVESILKQVNPNVVVDIWTVPKVFKPSKYTWDNLIEAAKFYDSAIFIFGPDDNIIRTLDNSKSLKTRDNVVLEYGLFSGFAENHDNIAICKVGEDVIIPTDLAGKNYIELQINDTGKAEPGKGRFKDQIRTWLEEVIGNTVNYTLNPYYFIKFDVIESSYIYEKGVDVHLRIFDEQLEQFRKYIENSNAFSVINKKDKYQYDDIYMYGIKKAENDKLIDIVRYCSDLLMNGIDDLNKVIKDSLIVKHKNHTAFINEQLRDIKVRISILTDDKTRVSNTTNLTLFKSKAINISSRFKFFGNYNSLTIDKEVYKAIDYLQSSFTELDISIDKKKDFFGFKDVLNKQMLIYAELHLKNNDYVFAADFLLQYYYDKNLIDDKLIELVQEVVNGLEIYQEECRSSNLSFEQKMRVVYLPVNTLLAILRSKYMGEDNSDIYMGYNKRALEMTNYFLNEKETSPCHTHYWMIYGLSPRNYFVNLLLRDTLEKISESGVHDGCSLCTSKNAIYYSLLKTFSKSEFSLIEEGEAKMQQLNKFLNTTQVSAHNYCVQNNRVKDLHYLAYTMQAAIVNGYDRWVLNNMLEFLNKSENWLDHCESSPIRLRGLIFSSLAIAYFNFPELFIEEYKQKFAKEFCIYIEDSNKFTFRGHAGGSSKKSIIPSPIVLDGIEGMIDTVRLGLGKWIGIKQQDIDLINILIDNSYQVLLDDTLWDESGMWGYERQRTYYRLSFWFRYWEYRLSLKNDLIVDE